MKRLSALFLIALVLIASLPLSTSIKRAKAVTPFQLLDSDDFESGFNTTRWATYSGTSIEYSVSVSPTHSLFIDSEGYCNSGHTLPPYPDWYDYTMKFMIYLNPAYNNFTAKGHNNSTTGAYWSLGLGVESGNASMKVADGYGEYYYPTSVAVSLTDEWHNVTVHVTGNDETGQTLDFYYDESLIGQVADFGFAELPNCFDLSSEWAIYVDDVRFYNGAWTSESLAIGEFQAPTATYKTHYFWLNTTVLDTVSASNIVNATVNLTGGVVLKWSSSGNVFSEYSDSNGYCTLNATASFSSSVNSTAIKLHWYIKLSGTCPSGWKDIESSQTRVYNSITYASGSKSHVTYLYSIGYLFYGALDETDSNYIGALNVSAYIGAGVYQNFIVNASLTQEPTSQDFPTTPIYFTWKAKSDSSLYRRYYPDANETTFYLYQSDATPTTYSVYIMDFTGKVTPNSTKIELIYLGSGSEKTVEKIVIPSYYKIDTVLVSGRSYIRQVVTSDGIVHRDTFNTGVSLTDTMQIMPLDFSDDTVHVYRYLTIQATRPTATHIQVSYSDTFDKTSWVNMTVWLYNGTRVFSAQVNSVPNGLATLTWNYAVSNVSYKVIVRAYHTQLGIVTKTDYLVGFGVYNPPLSISFLGNATWLTDLIPYAIILISGAVFSTLTVSGGMFVIVAEAFIFQGMGWVNIGVNVIILAFAIVILYFLGKRNRGEEVG